MGSVAAILVHTLSQDTGVLTSEVPAYFDVLSTLSNFQPVLTLNLKNQHHFPEMRVKIIMPSELSTFSENHN